MNKNKQQTKPPRRQYNILTRVYAYKSTSAVENIIIQHIHTYLNTQSLSQIIWRKNYFKRGWIFGCLDLLAARKIPIQGNKHKISTQLYEVENSPHSHWGTTNHKGEHPSKFWSVNQSKLFCLAPCFPKSLNPLQD